VTAYLVCLLEDDKIGFVAAADIESFKNGLEVQRDEHKAIQLWKDFQQQETQEDDSSDPELEFVEINKYSEAPCLVRHEKYRQRIEHDNDFWILYGCNNPVHAHCLRDVAQWRIGVGYHDGEPNLDSKIDNLPFNEKEAALDRYKASRMKTTSTIKNS
jgi:hypothetical protein